MSKKNNELKVKAKELYEKEGFSLAEIARKLNKPASTVKSWKQKEGWIKNSSVRMDEKRKPPIKTEKDEKNGRNPNSLANLRPAEENAHPLFEPGNDAALKHGMFAKQVHKKSKDVYDMIEDMEELTMFKEAIRVKFANYISGQSGLDPTKAKDVQVETQAARALSSMISEYLNMLDKRGDTTEDDNFIEAIKYAADKVWNTDE